MLERRINRRGQLDYHYTTRSSPATTYATLVYYATYQERSTLTFPPNTRTHETPPLDNLTGQPQMDAPQSRAKGSTSRAKGVGYAMLPGYPLKRRKSNARHLKREMLRSMCNRRPLTSTWYPVQLDGTTCV